MIGNAAGQSWCLWLLGCVAHELRNEIVEELILDRVSESGAELDTLLMSRVNPEGRRAQRAEDEEKRGKTRKRGHKAPLGEAQLSEEKRHRGRRGGVTPVFPLPTRTRRQSVL